MTNPNDDFAAPLRKLGIQVQELTLEEITRRREEVAAQMININANIVGLAMSAEEACSTIFCAFEFGDRIINASKDEKGKTYLTFGIEEAEVSISVQAILDLADLIRGDKPA